MIEIFDIETYPNYFLINTIEYESKKRASFCIDSDHNDLKKIVKWITKKDTTRVGHNILRYDNLLLKYLVMNYKYFPNKDQNASMLIK